MTPSLGRNQSLECGDLSPLFNGNGDFLDTRLSKSGDKSPHSKSSRAEKEARDIHERLWPSPTGTRGIAGVSRNQEPCTLDFLTPENGSALGRFLSHCTLRPDSQIIIIPWRHVSPTRAACALPLRGCRVFMFASGNER